MQLHVSVELIFQHSSWCSIIKFVYRISSNKRRASNKHRPLISVTPLGIPIEIIAFPLMSAAPLNLE